VIESVETVAFGRPATEALARAIEGAQQARRLAPVTVVVASNFAGLAARRTLGGRGLVNVNFVTPLRLAELLAADVLVDRQPLTNPVLASAVRRALAADPRPFGETADHVATEAAVAALYGELSRITPEARANLADDHWGRTVVDVYGRVDELLAGYHDEDAVARRVLDRGDLAGALAPFGHVVWYLPEPLSPAQTELVAAALSVAPSSVVVGLTGADDADRRVIHTCRDVGIELPPPTQLVPATADRIVDVTDADEEIRSVIRAIFSLAADGVPLDRIGVFYPQPRPYVRIIEQHVLAAGLPANGPSIDRLGESTAGRTVLAALLLSEERWRRDRVMAFISSAPLRFSGGWARVGAWDRISRKAGIVRDLADWHRKLDAFAAAALERVVAGYPPAQRDHDDAVHLRAFVDELSALIDSVHEARTWSRKVDAARTMLDSLFGREHSRQRWPESERDDLDRVVDALARLASLDALEPGPSHEVFTRALDAELDVARGRTNPYGTGLVYGPLVAAAGHDLDAVFVVGLAEGLCPMARRDEALLPERVRLLAGGQLATPDDEMAAQHRAVLAALAAAPAGRRTVTFPRGDLRSNHRNLPSRWLLDTASNLAGRTVHSTDFAGLGSPAVDAVASFAAALDSGASATSVDERDLASVAHYAAAGGDPAEHPAVAPVARAIEMQQARRSGSFTEFDGNLAGRAVPSPADGTILSASRLERWAHCGFSYFLADVLGLGSRDDPEEIVSVSPSDRGLAIHAVLERFIGEAIRAGVPSPGEPWAESRRARVHEIADDRFDELVALGRAGRALHWRLELARLHDLLDSFLAADDAHRAEHRAQPVRVELPFGMDGEVPVELTLSDGRPVLFRGKADRVDVDGDGRHRVLDYKSGKPDKYAALSDGDPVSAGTTLQLGLYAEAARQRLGATDAAGHYWLLDATTPEKRFAGYPWTDERRLRFLEVVETIVGGIDDGVFPQVPGAWDPFFRTHLRCRYCQFDSVCQQARGEHAEATAADPLVAVHRSLVLDEGDDADEVEP